MLHNFLFVFVYNLFECKNFLINIYKHNKIITGLFEPSMIMLITTEYIFCVYSNTELFEPAHEIGTYRNGKQPICLTMSSQSLYKMWPY